MSLTRRSFLAAAAASASSAATRPNVVMLMTDDHGAWATGAYGCPGIHTPNIDALAAGGVRFTNAFAATPVCSPSRMTYMTGAMPSHHHVQDWLRPPDSVGPTSRRWLDGFPTYSEILARNGYTLGMCGKWHMGHDDQAQAGFSYWATIPGGGGPYLNPEFVVNGERRKLEGFKTDLQTDFALDFLDRHHARPFYLYIPFYAPHTPYAFQPDADRALHAQSDFRCFPDAPKHPNQVASLAANHARRESKLAYSALVSGMDRNVGRILERLSRLGVRDNTLVVFTADQGWNAGHHGVWGKGNGTTPFNMYEESIRTPLIWNQPGAIRGGRTVDAMVSTYDYFPTILDHLGIRAPSDRRRVGRSYAPWLRGERPSWRSRLYFEYAYVRAIRTGNLKYIERAEGYPSELYDLEADPGESRNAIADPSHAAHVKSLRAELAKFFRDAGASPLSEWRKTTDQVLQLDER
jgi:arylsulfatase A-like enzyme